MKAIIIVISFIHFSYALAQVEISEPIIMTGSSSGERQIKSLGNPTDQADAVNAQTIQKGSLIYATASGTDSIFVDLIPSLSAYVPGTFINFKASNANTGDLLINVNNLGFIPIKKGINQNLDSADIKPNQLVSIIYDGTQFQVISMLSNSCPNGFVSVNKDYCIETNERIAASWWNAVITCMNKNARLCTMSEWSLACFNSGLALNNMLNNYEWVDSAANNASTAKTMGLGSGGVPGCDYGYYELPGVVNAYRCCFSK